MCVVPGCTTATAKGHQFCREHFLRIPVGLRWKLYDPRRGNRCVPEDKAAAWRRKGLEMALEAIG